MKQMPQMSTPTPTATPTPTTSKVDGMDELMLKMPMPVQMPTPHRAAPMRMKWQGHKLEVYTKPIKLKFCHFF